MEPISLFIRKNATLTYDVVMRGGGVERLLFYNATTAGDAVDGLAAVLIAAMNVGGRAAVEDTSPEGLIDALELNKSYLADAIERIGTLEQELALLKGEEPHPAEEGELTALPPPAPAPTMRARPPAAPAPTLPAPETPEVSGSMRTQKGFPIGGGAIRGPFSSG